MSSSTKQRIISGIVLVAMVFLALYFGKMSTLFLIFIFGLASIDELERNFFNRNRKSFYYLASQLLFVSSFAYFGFIKLGGLNIGFVYFALVQNFLLLLYLFFLPMESARAVKAFIKIPLFTGVFVTVPFMAMINMIAYDNWASLLLLLACINFGMDTFAWFWGKKFGKTKLWEAVSPKKTVEGLIGGALSAMILGYAVSYFNFQNTSLAVLPVFFVLACFSQLGDLIQSKLKRQIGIKDSSSLIPGHGGVYDRIDSMVFMAPLMAILVKIFYL